MAFREIEGDEQGNFFRFNVHGDALEGVFAGVREVDGKFGKQTAAGIKEGESLHLVTGWDVTSKLAKVEAGQLVRITYVADKDMGLDRSGQPKNPMKVFKVEVDDAPPAKTSGNGKRAPFA